MATVSSDKTTAEKSSAIAAFFALEPVVTPPLSLEQTIKSFIPPFATSMPKADSLVPTPGSTDALVRPDHQHPRPSSTSKGTLGSNGQASVVFTQVFDVEPAISIISIDARTQGTAIPDFDFTFTTDANGKYIGGTVYGRRARKLPTQPLAASPIGVTGLLTAVISGLNALASSITGYDTTEDAVGNKFSLIALKAT
jgi:hypothetical protein